MKTEPSQSNFMQTTCAACHQPMILAESISVHQECANPKKPESEWPKYWETEACLYCKTGENSSVEQRVKNFGSWVWIGTTLPVSAKQITPEQAEAIMRGKPKANEPDAKVASLNKQQIIDIEQDFIVRLEVELQKLGYDTSNWDGDESPEVILANGIHGLVINNKQPTPNWISVMDKLPEAGERFFVGNIKEVMAVDRTNDFSVKPSRLLYQTKHWTYWLPCTGIYQIPPAPVEEKVKDEFEEWWNKQENKPSSIHEAQSIAWQAALQSVKEKESDEKR